MTRRFSPRRLRTTLVAAGLILVGLVGVLAIGLSPDPAQEALNDPLFRFLLFASQTPGLQWVTFDVVEAAANVALFVPVGALVYLVVPRRLWVVSLLAGPALSAVIEAGQEMLPNRTASMSDVLLNSLGATLGVGLAAWLSLRAAKTDEEAPATGLSDNPSSMG